MTVAIILYEVLYISLCLLMIRIKITITNIYLKELAHFQDYISHTFYEVFVFVNLLAIENKDNYIDIYA